MTNHALKEPAARTLTTEEFLARIKPGSTPARPVNIPELGGEVLIHGLTVKEREDIKSGSINTLTNKTDEAKFITLTVIKGLFMPKLEPRHVQELIEGGAFGVLNRLCDLIWEETGVNKDGKKS